MNALEVHIIGGGLAGCEAAWQLARRGHQVKLFDMKPIKFSPAQNPKIWPSWSVRIRCAQPTLTRPWVF